ncbi:hypothetical protein AA0119_g12807 [Alternaria tenuissima]|uniref:Uncharacterized protein n=2 Tax=Alternaria alternata complex TaxID=187734 RepID=A0A4Q4MYE5_ALTAL|nr:hypothetical protein AA0115_g12719 [Alternaria tenuissima]RYN63454.1 hypothetical protein AA0117_g12768 [Alternaria alternata]RYN26124.1 hypothetical protein AA0114_g12650 [Alternaria tenuissima]RYN86529.1 hypothetical protein AA0119_g12807 [Alternaria tenuissima]RYO03928.1 hypothetical protein AA0121_g12973 [Alternaria tenuissima]
MVQRSTRSRNRQLRKRLIAIQNKLHQYGELGAEVALVIRFPGKDSGYSYVTSEDFLARIHDVRSNDKTANRTAEDVRTRSSKRAPESTGAATNTTPNAEAADTPEGDGTARSDHKDRFFPEPPVFGFACGQRIRGNRTGVV